MENLIRLDPSDPNEVISVDDSSSEDGLIDSSDEGDDGSDSDDLRFPVLSPQPPRVIIDDLQSRNHVSILFSFSFCARSEHSMIHRSCA